MKTPDKYKAPLRKREQIIGYLTSEGPWRQRYYENHRWMFCWDVKVRDTPDLSFDGLVTALERMGHEPDAGWDDPVFMANAREEHETMSADTLYEWGIEGMQRNWTGRHPRGAAPGEEWFACQPDDDGYSMLWDGRDVEARFAFLGRSGGWLVLTKFEGLVLDSDAIDEDALKEMDYAQLRRLYRFVVQTSADIRGTNIVAGIEEYAAFDFFINVCGGVETKPQRMKAWLADQSGEH